MKIEFNEKDIGTFKVALAKWGLNAQVGQCIEECAELIVVLQKLINRTNQPNIEAIIDEIADVEIMLAQIRVALGIGDQALNKQIRQKIAKLNNYLK